MRNQPARDALLVASILLAGGACAPRPIPKPAPAVVAPPPPPGPPAPQRMAVVVTSRPSGKSVMSTAADGSRTIDFEVLENGRGPSFHVTLRTGPTGLLERYEATGHDTMGIAVDERFSVEGGVAKWKSRADSGEKALTGPAFYWPIAGTPEVNGLLVAALQKAGGTLALLPEGTARLERGGEAKVKIGGADRHLVDWLVSGLDFQPEHVWQDDSGAFFGLADPWFSAVPEGAEAAIEPLVAAKRAITAAREEDLKKRVAHLPPAAGTVYTHARVLDVAGRKWLPDHAVAVANGRITAVGPTKKVKVPAGAEVVDVGGKALLPGLWDMHSHWSPPWGPLDIAAGVTTVRDVGNDPDDLAVAMKRYDSGAAVGPHIVPAGFIEGRGPKAAASKITAETEDEAKAAVEYYARRGYTQIKIYNSVKPELVPVLARLAHERGMRVSGHVPAFMRAEDAVRAGYDEINHINMLLLNFFVERETDTRSPLRFILPAERAAGLDLGSKPVKDFIALLVEKHTVIDPTLGVFEDLFENRLGQVAPGWREVADRLPVAPRRGLRTGSLPIPDEATDKRYVASFENTLHLVKALRDAKVPIVCGTDSVEGLQMQHELELHVRAGIPAGEVLENASLGSARVMKLDKKTGSIEVGKDADFFLVDGDPLAHIADVRKAVRTVRGGVSYEPKALYEYVGVVP